jgi:hypothetical protein
VNPSKSFQKYPIDIDGIFFATCDGLFNDREEYFATWPWMNAFLDDKIKWMNFYKRWMPNL